MPFIEIKACIDCPHHETNRYHRDVVNLDDMTMIKCTHERQVTEDYISVKLKNLHHSIYFRCPLEDDNEFVDYEY